MKLDIEERNCANEDCGKQFMPKVHNGIYCGAECRQTVMNKRVLARYHEKQRLRKNHNKRICEIDGCETILSRYNDESICEPHKTERLILRLISWGHDEAKLRESWSY